MFQFFGFAIAALSIAMLGALVALTCALPALSIATLPLALGMLETLATGYRMATGCEMEHV